MDATTTHSMSQLIKKLSNAHPTITFSKSDRFVWLPSTRTISYDASIDGAPLLLLHELAHALLQHHAYTRDVELVAMESAAWEKAVAYVAENSEQLPGISLQLSDDIVQNHLDTYRDWLHARSTCPVCSATGYQVSRDTYACPACSHRWRVNEARICALRRYSVK